MSLDLQEVFDKVSNHLLTQNEVSYDSRVGACVYRGPNGLKCAVGALISDEFYTPELEGSSIGNPITDNAVAKSLGIESLSDDITKFLSQLQAVHDNSIPQLWKHRLAQVANMFNLKFSPPETG